MIPRKRLDIAWSDLLFGLQACLSSSPHAGQRLEQSWSPERESVACLSVRSGFDALMSILAWPPGSEVLVSAVTIRDMPRLLTEHGLVPVPIDVDFETLQVSQVQLRRAITARTKGILVAHLFGSHMEMSPVCDAAQEHGLFVIEDCAQAFTGDTWRGHDEADVSMFSFGPIKTATALGGGLLRFRDPQLASRVREHVRAWPRQSNREFFARLLKYGFLTLLSSRMVYTLFTSLLRLLGSDYDPLISRAVRGFAGSDFLARIRRQPSSALRALLDRRIANHSPAKIQERIDVARDACELLGSLEIPGRLNTEHSYWVFPIMHDHPEALRKHLAALGFDATCGGSSLFVVPPADEQSSRAIRAEEAMARVLYLPIYPGVTKSEIARLAAGIASLDRAMQGATI